MRIQRQDFICIPNLSSSAFDSRIRERGKLLKTQLVQNYVVGKPECDQHARL